jgi:hypothetical protein
VRLRSRHLACIVALLGAVGSGARATTPDAQVPNPLPSGILEEPPSFDPASDVPEPSTTTDPPPTTGLRAVGERVRLIYAPGAFAAVCPHAADVPGIVTRYLARDPFGEPATRLALIVLDGDGPVPERARVELLDLRLEPIGSRVVEARDGCGELVDTAAFQLALALEPIAGIATTTPPAPAGPSAPPPPADASDGVQAPTTPRAAVEPPVTAETTPAPELFLTAGFHVAALLAPEGVMPGINLGLGGRWTAFSARVEGRLDFSGVVLGTTSFPVIATLMPCAHLPLIDLDAEFPDDFDDGSVLEASACLTASAGIVPAVGIYTGLGLFGGSGARLGIDWRRPDDITLRAFGQLEVAGMRPVLVNLDTGSLFDAPGINVLVGLGADLPDL